AGIELLALGDVLVRAEQPAVGHRPAHNGYEAPVAQLDDLRRAPAESLQTVANEFLPVSIAIGAIGDAGPEDLTQSRARLHLLAGQPVNLRVTAVGEHDSLLRIVEAH